MKKSMLDVSYEILQKKGTSISFSDLVNEVVKELGMSEEEKKIRISQFYTNLSTDGRFVVLADNFWDLRERVPFEKAHIDMNDAYNDRIDEDDDDEDDDDEEEGEEHESEDAEKEPELGEETPAADSYDGEEENIGKEEEEFKKEEFGTSGN